MTTNNLAPVATWHQPTLPDELLPRLTPAPPGIVARAEITRLQREGVSLNGIARSLNGRGIPTPSGRGQWWPDSVKRHVDPGPWADYIRRYRARQR